ncbi:hypothetical protein PRIPAC_85116 [Pristionchus pacificus]|uniref:Uncharacterized protein n=1 Tax=Pristionchus pacificus TaxID=54126 RepID=A0A2A6BMQ3_PRIPA|nr:hypothetical protein PRIPAC_85116 [Pristionchus pacificus]|eukprot:PDM67051.1 hypothetical protein PRIPAC_48468 [Pristionchus pacificus]
MYPLGSGGAPSTWFGLPVFKLSRENRFFSWISHFLKTGRYDPVARKLVDDLFEQYFSNGKKIRPDEAEKRMRERNDILPAQRMTFDLIRNRITTLLSQKKEHQRKEHGNRQRRYVKLIDDFERDLAEEEISLDDIEEEVDLERPLDEDDLIITSDEIYDLVHSNMEFFDNPSEPVFSDFGEFEQKSIGQAGGASRTEFVAAQMGGVGVSSSAAAAAAAASRNS